MSDDGAAVGGGSWLGHELAEAVRGEPWHGSSLARLLRDVDATAAAARPLPAAHTIWEIVLHVTAWAREVARRLEGAGSREPAEGDWPGSGPPTPAAWAEALRQLDAAHEALRRAVLAFPEARWSERFGDARDPAAGAGLTYAQMVNGVVQHDAYHAGQIGLLRKASG